MGLEPTISIQKVSAGKFGMTQKSLQRRRGYHSTLTIIKQQRASFADTSGIQSLSLPIGSERPLVLIVAVRTYQICFGNLSYPPQTLLFEWPTCQNFGPWKHFLAYISAGRLFCLETDCRRMFFTSSIRWHLIYSLQSFVQLDVFRR